MDTIYQRVAGLDLHLKTIVAAVRFLDPAGKLETDLRTFGTMTRDILALSDWLAECGVTHVAMEATGVLWKPVWNILDDRFELLLVNPRELKQVPGARRTSRTVNGLRSCCSTACSAAALCRLGRNASCGT